MREVLDPPLISGREPSGDLRLLIPRKSWLAVFFENLSAHFTRDHLPSFLDGSLPADFWPDVFVDRTDQRVGRIAENLQIAALGQVIVVVDPIRPHGDEREPRSRRMMRPIRAKNMTPVQAIGNRAARPIADQRGRHGRNPRQLDQCDQESILDTSGNEADRDKR